MATNVERPERVRVRTPGKYIVLFVLAAGAAAAAGVLITRRGVFEDRAPSRFFQTLVLGEAHYAPLPPFLVDLAPDADGRKAYLRLSASIVVKGGEQTSVDAIAALEPKIVERLTFFLRQLRARDFEGSAGMERVKREMLRRVNLVISPVEADEIVVDELVIQ